MAIKKGIKPTEEQQEAIAAFAEGGNIAIQAGAGTGKTSTLKMLGKYNKGRGQYIAFNKAIVEEAKVKFPRTIRCNTAHSLAWGAVMVPKSGSDADYRDRLFSDKRVKSVEIGRSLGFKPLRFKLPNGGFKTISVSQQGALVNRAITNFCQSADLEIGASHVPYIHGIDMPENGRKTWENNNSVREQVGRMLQRAWEDVQNPHGGFMQFKHEHYLKLWQLRDPIINAEFILFDECQDANPVILDIVQRQQDRCQLVFVGDSQQQIYAFTGAVNAFDKIKADSTTYLTQSFRFGEGVANVANNALDRLNAELRVKGLDSIESTVGYVGDPDVILTRTNANAIEELFEQQGLGKGVALVGGTQQILSFAEAARNLMNGDWTPHPELSCFKDWAEVQEYVKFDENGSDIKLMVDLIDKYGVPDITSSLRKTVGEASADIIISTAHKSKGLEWDKVRLSTDFPDEERLTPDELRLLYVAVTRAKLKLDVGSATYLLAQ